MSKKFLPILLSTVAVAASLFPALKAGSEDAPKHLAATAAFVAPTIPIANLDNKSIAAAVATQLFDSLKLERMGLSFDALQYAYTGYLNLKDKGALKNDALLSICDFSQSSFKKRLYIIDVKNFKVLKNTYVAHGKNTGLQYANKFSNTPESLQSSLGFFVTKGTYTGKHGLSLRLEGKEPGINHKAEERAIVMHGADYIGSHRLNSPYMGRSFGCPAVPQAESAEVINTIKNGTVLFIYHPSKSYLHGSTLLNA